MTATPVQTERSVFRRWAPWALLVIAFVALLAVGAPRSATPTLEQRTLHLAGEVRCPVCQGQSAAQSDTPASLEIRDLIRQKLQVGETPSRIIADVVSSYGPGILEKPPAHGVSLLVWLLPMVAVGAGVAGLGVAFARWRPRGVQATGDDRRLVSAALQPPESTGLSGSDRPSEGTGG